jgi:Mg/Co/Ni transporter MgtE
MRIENVAMGFISGHTGHVYDDNDDLQVADMMIRKKNRNIPVIDQESHLVGIITWINRIQQLL